MTTTTEVTQADVDIAQSIISAVRGFGVKIGPDHGAAIAVSAHRAQALAQGRLEGAEVRDRLAAGHDRLTEQWQEQLFRVQELAEEKRTIANTLDKAFRLMRELIKNQGNGVWWANGIRTFLANQIGEK